MGMDHRHLWLRSTKQHAIMEIRNAIIYASYEFFDKNGFIKFDSPILSGNAAEDSTELFETDYFGEPAFLTQSGQLYLEAGAMAFGRVFDFGPVFRAEKSKTRRHLTEFWMMDAEYLYLTHDESLDLQEAYVKALIQGVLDRAPHALETLEAAYVSATATIGEKISFRRFALLEKTDAQHFGAYQHNGGRIGVISVIEGVEELVYQPLHGFRYLGR